MGRCDECPSWPLAYAEDTVNATIKGAAISKLVMGLVEMRALMPDTILIFNMAMSLFRLIIIDNLNIATGMQRNAKEV